MIKVIFDFEYVVILSKIVLFVYINFIFFVGYNLLKSNSRYLNILRYFFILLVCCMLVIFLVNSLYKILNGFFVMFYGLF